MKRPKKKMRMVRISDAIACRMQRLAYSQYVSLSAMLEEAAVDFLVNKEKSHETAKKRM